MSRGRAEGSRLAARAVALLAGILGAVYLAVLVVSLFAAPDEVSAVGAATTLAAGGAAIATAITGWRALPTARFWLLGWMLAVVVASVVNLPRDVLEMAALGYVFLFGVAVAGFVILGRAARSDPPPSGDRT